MMRSSLLALALFLLPAAAPSVFAEVGPRNACRTYSLGAIQAGGESYDPTDPVTTRLMLRLRVLDPSLPASCADLPVVIQTVGNEGFPLRLQAGRQGALESVVPADPNARQTGITITLSDTARRDLVAGQTVDVRIADITQGQFVRPENFESNIVIRVGERISNAMRVSSQVLAVMRFEASEDYTVRDVNLGELTNGASQSLLFFYRTNSNVTLGATSENRGQLVQTQGAQSLPYHASFGGETLNLRTGPVQLNLPFSSAGLQSRELRITVPKPTELPYAGDYRDVIVLTFTPR